LDEGESTVIPLLWLFWDPDAGEVDAFGMVIVCGGSEVHGFPGFELEEELDGFHLVFLIMKEEGV
jgi:hypothetical protein